MARTKTWFNTDPLYIGHIFLLIIVILLTHLWFGTWIESFSYPYIASFFVYGIVAYLYDTSFHHFVAD